MHYNYYRYYDPETGRYITSDLIGLDGGLNTYGYVGGNPLRYIDPYGLDDQSGTWKEGCLKNNSSRSISIYSGEGKTESVPPGGSCTKGIDWDFYWDPNDCQCYKIGWYTYIVDSAVMRLTLSRRSVNKSYCGH